DGAKSGRRLSRKRLELCWETLEVWQLTPVVSMKKHVSSSKRCRRGEGVRCLRRIARACSFCLIALDDEAADQLLKHSTSSLERLPRPLFGNVAVLQHDEPVGFADRREAMGDHDRGAAARGIDERLLHQLFRHRVEM